MKIAIFGGINMDILGFPEGDARLRDSAIGRIRLRPGGVGRNIAAELAMLGASCRFFTALGDDALSDILANDCAARGIDISRALRVPGAACAYLCLHDAQGDMLAAVNDMALTARLDAAYARAVLPDINQAALCVLDANLPADTLCHIARHTRVPLLIDPVSCEKSARAAMLLRESARSGATVAVKPNLHEARVMTGEAGVPECAARLLLMGAASVFISLGVDGVYFADRDRCGAIPVSALSRAPKTGAGDAMCAGIALTMAAGGDARACALAGMDSARRFLKQCETEA